ncbi:MAG: hypothetical protein RMK94_16960 [Armatimonadota bacterium]|nr:hypothetical protein [Armatimonadota bacterium]
MRLWQRVLVGLWFSVVVGLTARLSEDVRLYAVLRQERLQLQLELQRLKHQTIVLQNKLRYLYTPEGERLVYKSQLVGVNGEKIFVLEGDFLPIGIMDLLPGGFEEWDEKKVQTPKANRWLTRLSRNWQRLRSERYR